MFGRRLVPGVYEQQRTGEPQDIDTTGLVGFWRLNDNTGTTAADETGAHPGTLVNSPSWVSGKTGTALSFDGTSQYVNIARTTALNIVTNTITLMAWIKPTVTSSNRRIISHCQSAAGGFEKYSLMVSGGTISLWIRNTADRRAYGTFTNTSTWSHVCGIYNGTTMYVYVNASEVGTFATSGNITTSTSGDPAIGRFNSGFPQLFSGLIDDVRIYSRAITTTELTQVYNNG